MKDKDYEQLATKVMLSALEGIKAQISKAYDKGYEDGKADRPCIDTEEAKEKAYNRGLTDMLEAVNWLRNLNGDDIERMFGGVRNISDVLYSYSTSKIIEKYNEFQKQVNEIKVGDEVRDNVYGHIGVVITDKPSNLDQISVWFPDYSHVQLIAIDNLIKTNKHYPQIAEVLKEMRSRK